MAKPAASTVQPDPPPPADPAPTGALAALPPSPDERLALLEATVIGLEERIVNLETRLDALSRIAVTREGPTANLRCSIVPSWKRPPGLRQG